MRNTNKHLEQVKEYMGTRIGYLRLVWKNLEKCKNDPAKKKYWTKEDDVDVRLIRARVREAEAMQQILLDGNGYYKVPYYINKESKSLQELKDGKKKVPAEEHDKTVFEEKMEELCSVKFVTVEQEKD